MVAPIVPLQERGFITKEIIHFRIFSIDDEFRKYIYAAMHWLIYYFQSSSIYVVYFLFFFYNIENIIEKILFRIDEDLGEGVMLREPNCTAQVTKQ